MILKENQKHWFFTIIGYLLLLASVFLTTPRVNNSISMFLSPWKSLILLFSFFFIIFFLIHLTFTQLIKFDVKNHFLEMFFMGSLIALAVFQFFVLFPKVITGRFLLLPLFIPHTNCATFLGCFTTPVRSQISALYPIISLFYPITPQIIAFLTRIFAILTVVVFYKILRRFVPLILSFLTSLLLLFSYYFVFDSLSIEPIMLALLFSYLAFYFYILSQDSKDVVIKRRYLILSFVSVLIASSGRFELALMLGLPYLFVLLITNSTKDLGKYFFIFLVLLLIFSYAPLSVYRPEYKDPGLKREHENMFSGFLTNFYYSVFVDNHLSLRHNYISLTHYLTIFSIIAYFFIYYSILRKKFIKKFSKKLLLNHRKFLIFIVYFLFYSGLILLLHREGFSSPQKYNINFYLSELIILSYFVYIFSCFIFGFKRIALKVSFVILLSLFLLSLELSPSYYVFGHPITSDVRAVEMYLLENVSLDPNCFIIKHVAQQPLIDYYKGLLKNDVFLGEGPFFYENLNARLKSHGCYYYYDAFHSDLEYQVEPVQKYNLTKIKNIALSNNCNVSTVFEHHFLFVDPNFTKTVSLLKIVC